MRNTLISSLLPLLLCTVQTAWASDRSQAPQQMGAFALMEESETAAAPNQRSNPQLRRIYQLESGETVEIIHAIRPDGLLELDAERQPSSTLEALDRYCSKIGGMVIRNGVSVFSRDARTLLSCVGGTPRRAGAGESNVSTAPTSPRNSCGATSSIVMDGPGSVYRGDPGGFAVHADAEFETVSSQVVSWLASFIPGCNVGESVSVNKWLWVSRGVVCPTGGLSPGIHEGSASLSVCGHHDQSSISTEVWAAQVR